jgi:hypothetical protein
MNPMLAHRLADDRFAARPRPTRSVRAGRPRPQLRRRVGALLVAAGLHLMTTDDRARPVSPLAS